MTCWKSPRAAGALPLVLLLLSAAASPLIAPAPASAQDVGLPIGATPDAPTLENLEGQPVEMGRWVGTQPVVLEFWATWCPLCAALEPALEAAMKPYAGRVALVRVAVGVNQSPRSIQRHLARHDLPGTILWDGEGRATRAFMAPSTSYVVVLDGTGKVVYTGAGEDQDLRPALKAATGG